jgi:MscS family membrane protein
MKPKRRRLCQSGWIALAAVGLVWFSLQAQTNTNTAGAMGQGRATNAPSFSPLSSALRELKGQTDILTIGLDRVPALAVDLFGIPLWQYLASLIYVFLAFNVSKILEWLAGGQIRRWADKKGTKLGAVLLDIVHGPIKVVSFVVLLFVGLELFPWPLWLKLWIGRALELAVAFSVTYMATKFIDLLLDYWRQRVPARDDRMMNDHLLPVVSKTMKIFVVIVAILITCQNVFHWDITAPLASLSIGGLALGLAAQDTLANLFGAVAVFIDKPFSVGDRVKLDNIDGVVESIGLRSTRVRSLDGYLITVPNKTMGNSTITNITRRPNIKTEMNIGITYDTPAEKLERALDILNDVYGKHPMTQDLVISFNKFADSALNINVVHWWGNTDYRSYVQGMQELNLTIKRRFDEERITFAFPTQTLHVKPVRMLRHSAIPPAAPNDRP